MIVRYSETNAYYSLDSQRDFEDFCEADVGQTVEGSRPGSDSTIESMTMSPLGGQGQGTYPQWEVSEEEAWQTPDDMDNNYSTRLIQERHTHKSSCHKRHRKTRVDVPWSRGMESKMLYAGTPRDVTTEFSERAARDVWLFVMMMMRSGFKELK